MQELAEAEDVDDLKAILFDQTSSVNDFQNAIKEKRETATKKTRKILDKLYEKTKVFGFHFAKIEIRHESNDIMNSLAAILTAQGFLEQGQELTSEIILEIFKDEAKLSQLKNPDFDKITDEKTRELAKRIFGRFKLASQNPEMFDKVIIAEFKEKINIHATMLLLAASGNMMGKGGPKLNIVPLAEDYEALDKLSENISTSFDDETYFEHIQATKTIYFMIAKSDTVRRDGVGAQEGQERAVIESIRDIIRKLIEKGVSNLSDYKIIPYNGGGHALQRGGGRITELPSVYGRYALRAIEELEEEFKHDEYKLSKIREVKISTPEFTVQGHQNYILFCENAGAGTLRSLIAQALYAQARLAGKIPDKEVETNGTVLSEEQKIIIQQTAKNAKDRACALARKSYEQVRDKDGPINRLFRNAPWVSTTSNNKSSRPGVRGGSSAQGGHPKIIDVKGTKNILLEQRAIGAEKLCAHSGTYLISWFSWADGLEAIKKDNEENKDKISLHEVYMGSKSFRDYMRSAAISLYMTDFETSWQMMIGHERPSNQDVNDLSISYHNKMREGKTQEITNAETLAYIETEANYTKELVFEAIYGRQMEIGEDLLSGKWPHIKEEIDYRKSQAIFASTLQSELTKQFNDSQNQQEDYDDDLRKAVEILYCGNDPKVNTPIGVLSSLTKGSATASQMQSVSGSPTKRTFEEKQIPLVELFKTMSKKLHVVEYQKLDGLARNEVIV